MKKCMVFLLAAVCALSLLACSQEKQEETVTYSFYGKHDYFEVLNCSVTLSEAQDVFDGGELEILQGDVFKDVTEYTTSFYILREGEQRILLSGRVVDMTGDPVSVNGDLGMISGESIFIGNKVKDAEELKENLWFELKTVDLDGEEKTYQIELVLKG